MAYSNAACRTSPKIRCDCPVEDGFTDIQGLAWSGFLRLQVQLLRTLNAELQAEHGITLSEYEVLFAKMWFEF
jgi:hypothetical protein